MPIEWLRQTVTGESGLQPMFSADLPFGSQSGEKTPMNTARKLTASTLAAALVWLSPSSGFAQSSQAQWQVPQTVPQANPSSSLGELESTGTEPAGFRLAPVRWQDPATAKPANSPVAVPPSLTEAGSGASGRSGSDSGLAPAAGETAKASSPAPTAGGDPKPAATTPNPAPAVKINGFLQADTLLFGQDAENRAQLGDIQDGAGFRRMRMSASGSIHENTNYFAQMDFGFFGRPTFTDVWGEMTGVSRLGNVRIGQWKQPFSLEVATSVRYQTFLERSLLFQAFAPFRHIGAGFYDHADDEMSTWAVSVFRTNNDQFGNDIGDNGGWSTAGRVTRLLWFDETECADGKQTDFLHLGSAVWFGDPGNNLAQYRSIPEAFVGAFGVPAGSLPGTSGIQVPSIANGTPAFVDTGALAVNNFSHLGTELVWARGPFAWQSEMQLAQVSRIGADNPFFWGYYTQVSWFLTGESRTYNRKLGQLDRITPHRPVLGASNCDSGPGAWEIAARVSHLDLDSQGVTGGRLTDLTLGVNWYLNAHTRFQINHVHAMLDRSFNGFDGSSNAHIIGARFQIDY